MSQIMEMYRTMGIRPAVYEFGTNIEKELKDRFMTIDEIAEYTYRIVSGLSLQSNVERLAHVLTSSVVNLL